MTGEIGIWIGFNLFVLAMLAVDLGVFHRKPHVVTMREAITWSAVWILLALGFNLGVYYYRGSGAAIEFFTGYLIEKSLSVDNIFVFVMIFGYFRVPAAYQHKVLFWGILGALLLRAALIFAGVELIHRFHASIYVFGAFLMLTGIKMIWQHGREMDPEKNPLFKLLRRWLPMANEYHEDRFFVRHGTRLLATPLFLVLLLVEITDLIFAVDSIPAILAITDDAFIVYTSNIFALLGLRSLYFALGGLVKSFHYLGYGLATILIFVGGKMLLADAYKVPIGQSLAVIGGILLVSIVASLWKGAKATQETEMTQGTMATQGDEVASAPT